MLAARNVSKSFFGIKALDDVCLEIERGQVHALAGENGAGKSTLMKILSGLLEPDSGSVVVEGHSGVTMIHQELMSFPDLTVAENISMGREPSRRIPGWVDRRAMRRSAVKLLARLGSDLDPDRKARGLSVAHLQTIEIARALAGNPAVILMDEPTSALSYHESERLFAIIRDLTGAGVAVLYTSHKMDEIFRLSHTVTVLRDGRHIATRPVSELDEKRLIALMVGRDLEPAPPSTPGGGGGDAVLEVRGLARPGAFTGINFTLRRGEIVGLAGLMGAGRTELAGAIFGLAPATGGEIRVNGRPVRISSPADALVHRIAMVTGDRKESGIVPRMSVQHNLTLAALPRLCRGPWINRRAEQQSTAEQMRALAIASRHRDRSITTLSGGNQQKVMIARALLTDPEILILDEPTRGIDVGAKAEVHAIMRRLAAAGKAVLMISSEMPEILSLSHRILVMRAGTLSAELDPRHTTQEEILEFAMPDSRTTLT